MEHKDINSHNSAETDPQEDAYYVLPEAEEKDTKRVSDKVADGIGDGVVSDSPEQADDSAGGAGDSGQPGQPSPVRQLLKVIMSPVEGWKEIKRSKVTTERMSQGCFYPLLALMAASIFASLIYIPSSELQTLVIDALVMFISYFMGYFCVILILKTLLPSDCRQTFETDFGRNFVMVAMSTLVIVQILIEWLPFLQPLLVFLPLYTIFLIVKGVRLLRCPERRETLLMVSISLLCIGIPPLLQWLFGLMMPVAAI